MTGQRYTLFLGCNVPVRNLGYELAARRAAEALGIELVDLPGFRCCGYPLKALDSYASLLVAAHNLCQAEAAGLPLVTLCNACSGTLTEADLELKEDASLRERVNRDLDRVDLHYQGTTRVQHFLRVLDSEIGWEAIRRRISRPLDNLQIAVHYGCHYFRPTRVFHSYGVEPREDAEAPAALDRLLAATGAVNVSYDGRNDCCGGGLLGLRPDLAQEQAGRKVREVQRRGADALLVACPTCGLNFSNSQPADQELTILYFPQLLGLALGLDPDELGLELNQIPADGLREKLGV
ncbi:CoB--CoM heterodisulfide reductase iron-sulfur subunit B family protein [Moorella naiadis]|uniref:CoB--CoM heterodisulfide reductase iron-sulfur subunit B family protein n=1 Tax=Moorella naiadis (nom. illeg.) TaxID=3093670 RepID=UPI003D9C850F